MFFWTRFDWWKRIQNNIYRITSPWIITISNDIKNEIISTLNQYGLPTNLTKGIDIKDLFDNTKNDKKVKNGKINWVLLKDIGSPVIKDDVPDSIVMDSIRETI